MEVGQTCIYSHICKCVQRASGTSAAIFVHADTDMFFFFVKATPASGPTLTSVRFTAPSTHLLHPWEPATITFPPQLRDGQENLFVLMAILQTETMQTDVRVNFYLYSHLFRKLMIIRCCLQKNHGSGLSAAIDSVSLST